MSLTKRNPAREPQLNTYLKRFENAVRAHEMRGSEPPFNRCGIDNELKSARKALHDLFEANANANYSVQAGAQARPQPQGDSDADHDPA